MAELLPIPASQDATAIVNTPMMTIALNTFMTFPLLSLSVFQVKKLVKASTEISVTLTQVIILNSLMMFSPPRLFCATPPLALILRLGRTLFLTHHKYCNSCASFGGGVLSRKEDVSVIRITEKRWRWPERGFCGDGKSTGCWEID